MKSSEDHITSKTEVSRKDVVEIIAKCFVAITAFVYATGFLIVATHSEFYGFQEATWDILKAKYLQIGILYLMVPVSLLLPAWQYHRLRTELTPSGIKNPFLYLLFESMVGYSLLNWMIVLVLIVTVSPIGYFKSHSLEFFSAVSFTIIMMIIISHAGAYRNNRADDKTDHGIIILSRPEVYKIHRAAVDNGKGSALSEQWVSSALEYLIFDKHDHDKRFSRIEKWVVFVLKYLIPIRVLFFLGTLGLDYWVLHDMWSHVVEFLCRGGVYFFFLGLICYFLHSFFTKKLPQKLTLTRIIFLCSILFSLYYYSVLSFAYTLYGIIPISKGGGAVTPQRYNLYFDARFERSIPDTLLDKRYRSNSKVLRSIPVIILEESATYVHVSSIPETQCINVPAFNNNIVDLRCIKENSKFTIRRDIILFKQSI